uniref:Uncharacterized protein n=1 Tax=mine drainage metagenome TaxID=410659 RepID=E6PS61_9ZZZZ
MHPEATIRFERPTARLAAELNSLPGSSPGTDKKKGRLVSPICVAHLANPALTHPPCQGLGLVEQTHMQKWITALK